MRTTLITLALAAAVALAACGGGDGGDTGSTRAHSPPGPPGPADHGDFKLTLERPRIAADRESAALVKQSGTAKSIVDAINQTIALPRDVAVRFASGEDGAAYDYPSRTLVVGYPFVSSVMRSFADAEPGLSRDDLLTKTDDVVGFVLLHEMGHALVDLLDIPITGREEDSVDNLATIFNVEAVPDGDAIALDFADFFSIVQNDPSTLSDVDFWDEHSLDAQRANDTICLVYGSDPRRERDLRHYIPRERRSLCGHEWRQADHSWQKLLAPYRKREGVAHHAPRD